MIPRGSNSFCLYDTRGLSDDPSENTKMFKRWMKLGVRNGELVKRSMNYFMESCFCDSTGISVFNLKVLELGLLSSFVAYIVRLTGLRTVQI